MKAGSICALCAITILTKQFLNSEAIYTFKSYEPKLSERMEINRPEHPAIEKINRFYCDYGSPACNTDFVSDLVRISDSYGVDPYLVVSISILESSGGLRACGFNWWGYASCTISFSDMDTAINTVIKTINSYGYKDPYMIASIWRTGTINDISSYPQRIVKLINEIE